MKSDFEKLYHQLETKHFWFNARRKYILQELQKADRDSKILDIGCSSGILLTELKEMGFKPENLYGIDISTTAINNCKNTGLENTFVMDAQNITLEEKFDIIISSDCLEHLENDEKALVNWHNLLAQNGTAYIFVPAFMFLWSEHDDANMHFRRYKRNELKNKLIKNNFEINKSSFWNFTLFTPILLYRLMNKLKVFQNKTGNLNKLPMFNNMLLTLLSFENKLLKYFNFPIGVSSFCIVKKKSTESL